MDGAELVGSALLLLLFWMEMVTFGVADFDLPYNMILGRPSLARFMVSTHYAYMVVKMSGPKGPIMVPIDMKGTV